MAILKHPVGGADAGECKLETRALSRSRPPAGRSRATPRERYLLERRQATRSSVLAGGAVAIVGMPLWSLFDHALVPGDAWEFTVLRLLATALIAASWALLFTPFGRARPEICGLGVVAPVQVAIAAMVVQLDDGHAAYALGMSLAIYASGLLLVWRLRFTLALIGISFVALALGWALSPVPVGVEQIATVAFYLLTAAAIAVVAQLMRDRDAWRVFKVRAALEGEQARTRELVRRLDRLSHEDSLTGLANRRAWDTALARECARVRRSTDPRTLSILLCDIDRLKEINDSLGHGTGDMVLKRVAELMRPRIRAADLIARIGGDEFAILALDTPESAAASLAEEIRSRIAEAEPGGPTLAPTLSVGVAEWDGEDDSPETLMQRADRRLYSAKARRNVVCAGDPVERVAE